MITAAHHLTTPRGVMVCLLAAASLLAMFGLPFLLARLARAFRRPSRDPVPASPGHQIAAVTIRPRGDHQPYDSPAWTAGPPGED